MVDNKKYIGYIKNGVNLDHIPCGNVWSIIRILKLESNIHNQTGVGLNLPSKKLVFKDLLKIENKVLSLSEVNAISPFCVGATLSIIEDYKVKSKEIIKLPDIIDNVLICPNERCVSKLYYSRFKTVKNRDLNLSIICNYCEQQFLLKDIKKFTFFVE
jgi:aspartate carbamoyltransferase regulatory subunit